MNVFLDTEFTDLYNIQLISVGLVVDSGEELYIELPYADELCSAFVREAVLPHLYRTSECYCPRPMVRERLLDWLTAVRRPGEQIELCADDQADIDLFFDAVDYKMPPWLRAMLIGDKIDQRLLEEFFRTADGHRHHALYDARANKLAFRP